MRARLDISLENGTQYAVWAAHDKLRKLKIALSSRMLSGEHKMINVCGETYEEGVARPVDLSIMTDQLAGVQLTVLDDAGNKVSQSNAT